MKSDEKKICRILDANYNRAKEGLRVCEDICRFLWDDRVSTRKFKEIRHDLTKVMSSLKIITLISSREIEKDVGRTTTHAELC